MGVRRSIVHFPSSFREFVRLFNERQYWESHEVLEGAWRLGYSTFYKGMIIYASAFVHAQRGNPRGVLKQLKKARGYLREYAPSYMGIDVLGILKEIERYSALVDVVAPAEGEALSAEFPFPTLELSQQHVRGDEEELLGSGASGPTSG